MSRGEHINAVDLAFDERGRGPALLLLHPFPFDRRYWAGNLPVLADAGYRVIALDCPGWSTSPPPPRPLSIVDLGDRVAALMDRLEIEQAVVAGLSMGGYVALSFAAKFPDRLAALILADTRAAADGVVARQGRAQAMETIRDRGVEAYLQQCLPQLVAPGSGIDLIARLRDLAEVRPEVLTADIVALRDRPDRGADLPRITCPTLIVVGEQDQVTAVAEMRAMADVVPNARCVVLPDVGHLSSIEAPALFNQAVLTFLSGAHPGTSGGVSFRGGVAKS